VIIGPAATVALLWALWAIRRASASPSSSDQKVDHRNPVELLPALGFAALVAVMAVATRWAEQRFGGAGAGTVIVISGSFDVDAAIVTLGGLPPSTFPPRTAGLVLAGPVLINTIFKAAIVLASGGSARWQAAAPLLAAAGAMIGAIVLALIA
jgi:uncharacterized membrane protein (DUF4010 family)